MPQTVQEQQILQKNSAQIEVIEKTYRIEIEKLTAMLRESETRRGSNSLLFVLMAAEIESLRVQLQ